MPVSVSFLVAFFVVYLIVKGFLFWRLNVALRKVEDKQQALSNLPSFDATRGNRPGGPTSGGSPLSEI